MKLVPALLIACLTASAANLRWEADFSFPAIDGSNLYPDGTPLGTLTISQPDGGPAVLTLTLEPTFSDQPFPAWFIPDGNWFYTGVEYLMAGVEYPADGLLASLATDTPWLRPFWREVVGDKPVVFQTTLASTWGDPVEWSDPVEPPPVDPPPIDPGGGGGVIPEPGTYALLFGLGLVGFASWRRYATR